MVTIAMLQSIRKEIKITNTRKYSLGNSVCYLRRHFNECSNYLVPSTPTIGEPTTCGPEYTNKYNKYLHYFDVRFADQSYLAN